jgi:hypothetical protein
MPGVRKLERALKIRPGESATAFRLLGLMVVVWTGSAIGATGAESLLFARFGPQVLPTLYILLGFATLLTMLAMSVVLARSTPDRGLPIIPLALAVVLVPARLILQLDIRGFYPVLWLLMMVTWTIQGMAVWGLAGTLSDTRQAKRLFPLYGAGMILGGAIGGLATRPLAAWLHAENLLLVWAGALVAGHVLARSVVRPLSPKMRRRSRRRAKPRPAAREIIEGLRFLRNSPLLRSMAWSMALFSLLYFTLTLPFAKAATARFPDPDQLAGFLGAFFGLVNAAALLLSLVAANRLFSRFGVATVVFALPLIYLAGFGVLSVQGGFVVLVVFRFLQMAWFYGLWSPAWQALFNVIPPERRGPARVFMDAGPLQAGTVVAGALLFAVDRLLTVRDLALAGVAAAALATVATWRARRGYRGAVVAALRAGRPDVFRAEEEPFGGFRQDGEAVGTLLAGATDPDLRVRRVALQILADLPSAEADAQLAAAVRDPDAEARVVVFEALVQRRIAAAVEELVPSLADPDPSVRARATDALGVCGATPEELAGHLGPLLADPDPVPRARAAALLVRKAAHPQANVILAAMVSDPRPEWRAASLEAIPDLGSPERAFAARLVGGLADPDPLVRRAAASALGRISLPEPVGALVTALGDEDRMVQEEAANALAALGESGPLVRALSVPRLESGAVLALRRLPPPPPAELGSYAAQQAGLAAHYHRLWSGVNADGDERLALLAYSLRQRAVEHAILALRAVAPFDDPEAVDLAVENLGSREPQQVANALETLETVGNQDVMARVLPLWERGQPQRSDVRSVIEALLSEKDAWLRACAVLAASALDDSGQRRSLEAIARSDPEPVVREAAAWTLEGGTVNTMTTLPLIERVLFLRRVPLFAELSPHDLKRIAEAADEHAYVDGDVIAESGEAGDAMHVVVLGEISVRMEDAERSFEIARRGSGEYVGEMAVISDEPRMASLVAAGSVRTLSIDRKRFERIVLERPQVSLAVMRGLCDRLREAHGRDAPAGSI